LKSDGDVCGKALSLKKCTGKGTTDQFTVWGITQHGGCQEHTGTAMAADCVDTKKAEMVTVAVSNAPLAACFAKASTKPASPMHQKVTQMRWYVYSTTIVSKQGFQDRYFREMLLALNPKAVFITTQELSSYVSAEFANFLVFVKFVVSSCSRRFHGNKFVQAQHDGVTLSLTHLKYQSMAIALIFEFKAWVLCIGFPRCTDGTNGGVTALYKDQLLKVTGKSADSVVDSSVQDLAAMGVGAALVGSDDEDASTGCMMHQSDKVLSKMTGKLVTTKNKKEVDGFPEMVALCGKHHRRAVEFLKV